MTDNVQQVSCLAINYYYIYYTVNNILTNLTNTQNVLVWLEYRHGAVCAIGQRHRQQASCRRAAAMICPAPLLPRGRQSALRRRADGNVAAVSHGQHVPTAIAAAAWCANMAINKAAWWHWPLTFWRSRVTWATSVPILIFLGLSVLDLGLMYATDKQPDRRQTDVRQYHHLMPPPIRGGE